MIPSRRAFLQQSLAVAGTFAMPPLVWGRTGKSTSSLLLKTGGGFEPAYLKMEREGRLKHLEKELWEVLRSCRCWIGSHDHPGIASSSCFTHFGSLFRRWSTRRQVAQTPIGSSRLRRCCR